MKRTLYLALLLVARVASAGDVPVTVSYAFTGNEPDHKVVIEIPIPPNVTTITNWSASWWFPGGVNSITYLGLRWYHNAGVEHFMDHAFGDSTATTTGNYVSRRASHSVNGSLPPRVWVRLNCNPAPGWPANCIVYTTVTFE